MTIERLRDRRLVTLQRGSGFRRHLEEAWSSAGVPFRPAVEVGNLSLVRRFVAAGLGVAPGAVDRLRARSRDRATTRRRLRGVPPVPYVLARRAGVPLTAAAQRFVELLGKRGQ